MIVLWFIVVALVAGFIADYLVGGRRKYERWELFVAGIVGSFVGGLIFNLIDGAGLDFRISGMVGSTIGAIVVLLLYGPLRDRMRRAA